MFTTENMKCEFRKIEGCFNIPKCYKMRIGFGFHNTRIIVLEQDFNMFTNQVAAAEG